MNAVTLEFLLEGRAPSKRGPAPDLVAMIRQGISAKSLETLAKTARVSNADLGDALGIPQRTLARRKSQGTLTAEESAKVVLARRIPGQVRCSKTWIKRLTDSNMRIVR
jgi:uncharacterized protein (DUF2384 family)